MDNNIDIFQLIDKQFSKQLSKEEETILRTWYESSADNKQTYKEYYLTIKGLRILQNKRIFASQIESVYADFAKKTGLESHKENRPLFAIRPWMRYAAIFVLAFGLGAGSYYTARSVTSDSHLAQTIEIPYGSKSKVTLPDGTSVWLNSGSRLSYQESFGHSDRNVSLDGEAYFEVTKDKELPFSVLSGKVKIKVLGTKFNFKSYAEDESARVTLVEGSLNVANTEENSKNVLLTPNQQAVINKKENRVTVKDVDAKSYAMWTQPKQEILDAISSNITGQPTAAIRIPNVTLRNTLFFNEEPLSQIVRDLERAFNVKIEIKDKPLCSERFYGDFRNDETITEILDIMAANNNLCYTIDGDEIIISRNN
ncbi:FecR family protein [Bacteroides sp.]